jgi:Ca2+-binding RTX toxin-like protein
MRLKKVIWASLLLVVQGVVVAPPAAAGGTPSCFGEPATLVGTDKKDRLIGTSSKDVIVGLGGRDWIEGKGGDDLICSGGGRWRFAGDFFLTETVDGGRGDDRIDGQGGPNELVGGSGQDLLKGRDESDILLGGPGDDVIRAGPGQDFATGGAGHDLLLLGADSDSGSGMDGDDEVYGGPGPDALGSDRGFTCGGGPPIMTCDAGGLWDEGNDLLHGGSGYDLIAFGRGADVLDGGRGKDEATFSTDDDSTFMADLESGEARGAGIDTLSNIEDLSAYSDGSISLFGNDGPNELAGGASRDSGASTLFDGRGGNDNFLLWRSGELTVEAGTGDDVVDLASCSTSLSGSEAISHSVDGGEGNDRVGGSCVDDRIQGGPGDDTLVGREGIDTIDGGPGHDACSGELVSNCEP